MLVPQIDFITPNIFHEIILFIHLEFFILIIMLIQIFITFQMSLHQFTMINILHHSSF